jgi:hypothetical protein
LAFWDWGFASFFASELMCPEDVTMTAEKQYSAKSRITTLPSLEAFRTKTAGERSLRDVCRSRSGFKSFSKNRGEFTDVAVDGATYAPSSQMTWNMTDNGTFRPRDGLDPFLEARWATYPEYFGHERGLDW